MLGLERSEELPYARDAQDQQDQHNYSIYKRPDNVALQLEDVTLFRDCEMQDSQRCDQVDSLVKSFPILFQADFPTVEGSHSQRNQHQEGDDTENDVRLFNDILENQTPGQAVIQV